MSKKVVITGCCGFVGRHLMKRCLDGGYSVIGYDDYSTTDQKTFDTGMLRHIKFYFYDLGKIKPDSMAKQIEGSDAIFHLAAKARVQPSFENIPSYNLTNVQGTALVLEACKRAQVNNFIFAGSSSVYGNKSTTSKENDVLEPSSPYAMQKKMAEDYINFYSEHFGIKSKILRYFNVYGNSMTSEGQYMQAMQVFLNQLSDELPFTICGTGEQRRDFTNIDDVVEANMLAMSYDKSDTFNIGTGVTYSINELCDLIGGKDYPKVHLPARNEPDFVCADNSKAKKLLKWEPKTNLTNWISQML